MRLLSSFFHLFWACGDTRILRSTKLSLRFVPLFPTVASNCLDLHNIMAKLELIRQGRCVDIEEYHYQIKISYGVSVVRVVSQIHALKERYNKWYEKMWKQWLIMWKPT